jgi:zinc transport system substrate-binding protein
MTYRLFFFAGIMLLSAACEQQDPQSGANSIAAAKQEAPLVIASNYPLYFFANRIVADVAAAPEIVLPEIAGDPASWVPNAEQVRQLQTADLVLLNGAGADSWLNLISIDRQQLVDTTGELSDQLISVGESVLHQHGPEGEHSHDATAFTVWLDPLLASQQAQVIADALINVAPSGEAEFRENLAGLQRDLVELDARLMKSFSQLGNQPVLFSHPVYQYLERRYEINGRSLHWEPDQSPSTADWIDLQQIRASHAASIIFWEDEPMTATSERLSDAGIVSVLFRPVANRPVDGDFLSVMHDNAKQLDLALVK